MRVFEMNRSGFKIDSPLVWISNFSKEKNWMDGMDQFSTPKSTMISIVQFVVIKLVYTPQNKCIFTNQLREIFSY